MGAYSHIASAQPAKVQRSSGGHMRRREFIKLVGGAATLAPLAASAQPVSMPVIGWLGGQLPQLSTRHVTAFGQGLLDAGFVVGQNVAIEYRWADNDYSRLPALATDFVQRRVTLIAAVSHGSTPPRWRPKL